MEKRAKPQEEDKEGSDFIRHPTGRIPKGHFCPACARYNSRQTTCSTLAVKDGKVLLVKRKKDPMRGYWAIPGGYIDWDETLEQAAARELWEETGYKADKVTLLGIQSDPNRDEDGRQNIEHMFIAYDVKEDKRPDAGEVSEMKWFPIDSLPDRIAFDHREVIEEYKRRFGKDK